MSHLYQGRGVAMKKFQKIRNERILELRTRSYTEARRQLEHDLQRIGDMKSSSGILPFALFPKVVWENIFEFLGPKDLGAISEVHDVFQEQLSRRHVYDILLPQVLNLRSPGDQHDHYNGDNCDIWMKEMPLEELSMKKLIRLRKVSKSMRNHIDLLFESMMMNNLFSKNECSVETMSLTFSEMREQELFLDKISENFGVGSNKASRFFRRSLKINLFVFDRGGGHIKKGELLERLIRFQYKVTRFLKMIGEQLWRFEVHISSLSEFADALSSQIYVALLEWVELMPNLKWLVLDNHYHCKKMKRLPTFPRLEHLVRICWRFDNADDNNHAFQIFSAILMANVHVKVLNVNAHVIFHHGETDTFFRNHFNPFLASLPSLALAACFINSDKFEHGTECNFASIQPSINPNWPLKSLHLGCDLFNSKLKFVFELLQNFQTLEQLVLGELIAPRFDGDIPFLNLPNLTHLKLEIKLDVMEMTPATNFFFSLQFLLYAKKLKKFVWKLAGWRTQVLKLKRFLINRECNEQCVNFRAGMRDLRSSNLWDIFPNLEKVTTEIRKAHENTGSCDDNEYHRSEKF